MCWRREAVSDANGAMIGHYLKQAFEVRKGTILVKSCEMIAEATKWLFEAST
jgi:hypothetical protein